MAQDFYTELGVGRTASADEIKKSYRKLAAELHPDKRPGDKKSETRFKAVNRAYQALSDPEKRKIYDEFGEDGLREGFDVGAARAYRGRARGGPGGYAGQRRGHVRAGRREHRRPLWRSLRRRAAAGVAGVAAAR